MTNFLSNLGYGLSAVAAGMSDPAMVYKQRQERDLGRILSEQTIPEFARAGGAEPDSPENIRKMQLAQIANLGTPAGTSILTKLSPLSEGTSSDDPAAWREWIKYNQLLPADQKKYMSLKRSDELKKQGLRTDETGNVEQIPGYAPAKSDIGRQEEAGKQKSKLFYEPLTAAEIERQKRAITGSPAEAEFDKTFAAEYQDYTSGGGATTVKKNLRQLEEASKALAKRSGLSGPTIGSMPDVIVAFAKPEAIDVREKVQEVAQRNLRLVLGGQFAQKEGEQLIARVYNPMLPESTNMERIAKLFTQIKDAAEAKESAGAYFSKNGTLRGWQGKLPTLSDFDPDSGGDQIKSSVETTVGESPVMTDQRNRRNTPVINFNDLPR